MSTASSHLLAELLYTQAKEFVGIYDPAIGWFTQINSAGVKLLGYPSEEVFLADLDPAQRQQSMAIEKWRMYCEMARTEGRQEIKAEILRRDGKWFNGYIELSSFEVDHKTLFMVRLSEQTRLQQAERELAHSVRRFEAVFTNATIGIIVCNQEGVIVSANQLADRKFGYDPHELLGQRIEVLVPNAVGRHHAKLRQSFNANPQVRNMGSHRDLLGLRKDGSVFPVEVSLSYFYLDQELYVVAYIVNITLKKAAEQELIAERQRVELLNAGLEQTVADRTHALRLTLEQLEQRSAELAQALAAEQELGELKSRFVSMASHEFRTPLTAVLTSAALIEKYPGGDQQDKRLKHLQRIKQSVTHLNDILEEFLSVGRIEEGKIQAHPAYIQIEALLDDTIADVQESLKPEQKITKRLHGLEMVWLDPSLLRKILVNLLSNAIKYSGAGSVVRIMATCRDNRLIIEVKDHGVGISPEDQEHLFERFFRARNVTNLPGTGLGLYIITRYLELMSGTIRLDSELGQGTSVTITIPYDNPPVD
jgi:PAS domain S-box-containing protein